MLMDSGMVVASLWEISGCLVFRPNLKRSLGGLDRFLGHKAQETGSGFQLPKIDIWNELLFMSTFSPIFFHSVRE